MCPQRGAFSVSVKGKATTPLVLCCDHKCARKDDPMDNISFLTSTDSSPPPMTVCKGTDGRGHDCDKLLLATEPSDTVKQQSSPSSICIYDNISACTLPATMNGHVKLSILLKEMGHPSKHAVAMVDSVATGNFLNKKYA